MVCRLWQVCVQWTYMIGRMTCWYCRHPRSYAAPPKHWSGLTGDFGAERESDPLRTPGRAPQRKTHAVMEEGGMGEEGGMEGRGGFGG